MHSSQLFIRTKKPFHAILFGSFFLELRQEETEATSNREESQDTYMYRVNEKNVPLFKVKHLRN
jgi:hypothetical protein